MATMAAYLRLLILSTFLIFCSHFHHSRCRRRHPPSKTRKLFEESPPMLFPPVTTFPAPGDNSDSTAFPSFQEPLLPPGPVANYLLPNLPFPKMPTFPTTPPGPDSIVVPGVPVTPLFPTLPFPLPPGLLNPGKPLFPGHSRNNNEQKDTEKSVHYPSRIYHST